MNKKISELDELLIAKNDDITIMLDTTDPSNIITKKIKNQNLKNSFLLPINISDVNNLQLLLNNPLISGPIFTTQISSSNITSGTTRFITLGYDNYDDRSVTYWKNISTPSTSRPWHRQSADGRWWEMFNSTFTPQMFGAKADNNGTRGSGTDNTSAMRNFFDACAILGGEGYIPAGSYRIAQQLLWDVGKQSSSRPALFPSIKGAGDGLATLIFDSSVASPCFQISSVTGFTGASGSRPIFYGEISGFSVETLCNNGIGLLIGAGDILSGGNTSVYFNGTKIGPIGVANRAQTVNSTGVLTSGLTTCWVNLVSNCGGVPASHGGGSADFYGVAHRIQHCNMCSFYGAMGSANIGTYVTIGSCFGNTWNNIDWEVLGTCFKCDVDGFSGNGMNKIIGGTMTLCDYAFDITRGQGLEAEGHLLGDIRVSIIKNVESDVVGTYGGYGLRLRRPNRNIIGQVRSGSYWNSNPTTPPGPGSPTPVQPILVRDNWIRNRWGQAVNVYIYSNNNNTLEIFKRSWFDYTSAGARVGIGPITFTQIKLEPGQAIRIPTSAAAATWYWEPAE